MKKITKWPVRKNLAAERKYELANKTARNASKAIKTPIRQEARKKMEEKLWRKLKTNETVDHIKPIAKWGSNSMSKLRVIAFSKNIAGGGRMWNKK